MLQDPVELCAHRLVARRDRDEKIVQVGATARRASLHELQIIGREDGHAEQSQQIARTRDRVAIHTYAIPTGGSNLGLQQLFTIRLLHGHADERCFGTRTHERSVWNTAKRVCRRRPAERLEEAGLALAVGS